MNVIEQIKSGAAQFFETVGEGWSKLVARSGRALTRFTRGEASPADAKDLPDMSENWGFLAGEIVETGSHLVVRMEVPGMDKSDFEVVVENGHLFVRGEKRFHRTAEAASYHLFEAAYGRFERSLALPRQVDPEGAEASYEKGVLTIRLPKSPGSAAQSVKIV